MFFLKEKFHKQKLALFRNRGKNYSRKVYNKVKLRNFNHYFLRESF